MKKFFLFHHFTMFLRSSVPVSLICLFTVPLLYAQVNLLEPLRVGVESKIPEKTSAIILEGMGFSLAEKCWEVPFLLAFRPMSDCEFGTKLSIVAKKSSNQWFNGIADTLLAGKYLFFRESVAYPAVFGELAVSFPSGDFDRGLGKGSFGFIGAAGMERTIGEIHEHIFLNYQLNTENNLGYKFGNVFAYTAGVSFPLKKPLQIDEFVFAGDWEIVAEFKGLYHTDAKVKGNPQNDAYNELYISTGTKYKSKWGKYVLSLLIGLTKESYSYQVHLSVRY